MSRSLALSLCACLALVGCGDGPGPKAGAPHASPSRSAQHSPGAVQSPDAPGDTGPAFITRSSQSKGPGKQAVVTDIRFGAHPGYDRLVVDFRDGTPSWQARYVTRFVADASGEPVRLAGAAGLELHLQAAGHDADYQPVYQGPKRSRTGGATLLEWAVTGDFEGQFTIGLGLKQRAPYRVFTLTGPPRLVVDLEKP